MSRLVEAQHRVRGARHSINQGAGRLYSTYKEQATKTRRRHRAAGPPSYPWILEVMLGLLVIRPAL